MLVNSAGHGVPDTPHYTTCVAELKATEPSASSLTMRELTLRCQERYRQLSRSALIQAIHAQWLIGEASAEGIRISNADVRREFEMKMSKSFQTNLEFEAYLKKAGRRPSGVMFQLKVARLADGIVARVHDRQRPVTQAEVAGYYDAHKERFATAERRDVRIVRTTTRAAALAARRKIESGTSFASVAKHLSPIVQPVRSERGLVVGLTPLYYSEKPLSDAIFSARRGRVYGPVFAPERKVVLSQPGTGYFVFEVSRVTPRRQRPLVRVRSEIASLLMGRNEKRALAAAVKTFRRKWIARTYCSPGYIVTGCREAKPSNSPPPDPYAL
jgi:foldase protein PrsA